MLTSETLVYIFINTNSHQGQGLRRWYEIEKEVLSRLPGAKLIFTRSPEDLVNGFESIGRQNNHHFLISAGGDGSLHYLANCILGSDLGNRVTLGAIGLGSSNDFLKPFQSMIADVPVRINTTKPSVSQDVGRVCFTDGAGRKQKKFFVVNASFGATAEGNHLFNHPGRFLSFLKKRNTAAAISYTAFSTLMKYRNRECTVSYNGLTLLASISNVNILKIPYVSGSMHYKQDIGPDDGRFGLNICRDMGKMDLIKTLMGLEKGIFTESKKKISTFTDSFSLRSDRPIIFECDGETEESREIEITLLPRAIKLAAF